MLLLGSCCAVFTSGCLSILGSGPSVAGSCTSGLAVPSPLVYRHENNDSESENRFLFPLTMCRAVLGTLGMCLGCRFLQFCLRKMRSLSKKTFHLFPKVKAKEEVVFTKRVRKVVESSRAYCLPR